MDIKQLHYFIETCKRMNLSTTADALYITHQALSKSIKKMEAELGYDLFYRTQHALQLTDYGRLLYQHAAPILDEFHMLSSEMQRLERQKAGHVRISCISSILQMISKTVIVPFMEKYPEIRLEIIQMPDEQIEEAVLSRRVDVAVCLGKLRRASEIDCMRLLSDRVGVVMRRDNPLFLQEEVRVAQLRGQAIVSHSDMYLIQKSISETCRQQGFLPSFLLCSPDVELNKSIIHRFPCISIGPHILCARYPYSDQVGYRPFAREENLEWNIYLITQKGKYPGIPAETFISHLVGFFRDLTLQAPCAPEGECCAPASAV